MMIYLPSMLGKEIKLQINLAISWIYLQKKQLEENKFNLLFLQYPPLLSFIGFIFIVEDEHPNTKVYYLSKHKGICSRL